MKNQIFNYEEVLQRYFGEKELIEEIIIDFVKKTGQQVEEITAFLELKTLEKIMFNAHSIKGGASNISANALSRSAALMEEAANESNLEKCRTLFPSLEEEYLNLKSEIERLKIG